jgi:hypothetical protein
MGALGEISAATSAHCASVNRLASQRPMARGRIGT